MKRALIKFFQTLERLVLSLVYLAAVKRAKISFYFSEVAPSRVEVLPFVKIVREADTPWFTR